MGVGETGRPQRDGLQTCQLIGQPLPLTFPVGEPLLLELHQGRHVVRSGGERAGRGGEQLGVESRAPYGPVATHKLDAGVALGAFSPTQQHHPDFPGRADVRSTAGAAVNSVNGHEPELAITVTGFAEPGGVVGVLN